MLINKDTNDEELVISIEGRLDTMTALQLEAELKNSLNGVQTLKVLG